MADKRHQKAIAKGIVCQVAYNHQNDNRRAQKLVPAKDLAKEERRPAGSEHDPLMQTKLAANALVRAIPLAYSTLARPLQKAMHQHEPHSNGLTESRAPAK